MLIQYPLQPYIPNNEVQPISDNISSFPFEAFRFQHLLAEALDHAGRDRFSLRTVLLEILCDVVVVDVVVYQLECCQQVRRYVHHNILVAVCWTQSKFDAEFVSEIFELGFL